MLRNQGDNRPQANTKATSNGRTTLLFWSLFLLLNGLLFLPGYLFDRADSTFWPLATIGDETLTVLWPTLLLQRENLDVFRLSLEWTLLAALWVFFPRRRARWLAAAITGLYLLQLVYAGYEAFMHSTYLLAPNFYNDYLLFTNGASFVFHSLDLPPTTLIGGLLLTTAALAGLIWLLRRLLSANLSLGWGSRLALVLLLSWAFTATTLVGEEREDPETAVATFSVKLSQNLSRSREAFADASRFDKEVIQSYYAFTANDLAQTPNIYIIFIESYGSVLFQRDDFMARYRVTLRLLEDELAAHDWLAASNRSHAPTWGGGSWIAYTSALSGLRLENHAEYQTFLNQYQRDAFPHLFNYLRSQGYRSYRLSGMAAEIDEGEWQRYKSFYGVDEWLRFSDVDYTGPLYGWGPALPDQYALNYAHNLMRQDSAPHVFFYITQNSHYPWTPLPDIVSDWRTLNDLPPATAVTAQSHQELRRNYLAAIQYELEMLVDFIVHEGSDDDIFILMGDHQPSRVARYADGWDTPLHVIGRDPDFVESFIKMGFVPGLDTRTIAEPMYHEGFYTLFSRALLQRYGQEPDKAPRYLPNGVPFS